MPTIHFHSSFDERAALEMPMRGYASHVAIEVDGEMFPVFFIDPVRLQQELADNEKAGNPFFAEPGLVVLCEVTLDSISVAVDALWRQGYFEALKSKPVRGGGGCPSSGTI